MHSLLVVGHRGLLCCCSSTFSSGLQNGRHLSIQFLRKVRQPTLVTGVRCDQPVQNWLNSELFQPLKVHTGQNNSRCSVIITVSTYVMFKGVLEKNCLCKHVYQRIARSAVAVILKSQYWRDSSSYGSHNFSGKNCPMTELLVSRKFSVFPCLFIYHIPSNSHDMIARCSPWPLSWPPWHLLQQPGTTNHSQKRGHHVGEEVGWNADARSQRLKSHTYCSNKSWQLRETKPN